MSFFAGKRIWVIGASAGIGEAMARALQAQGAQLILSARSADVLRQNFPDAQVLPLDLLDPASLPAACAQVTAPLDAVICTAALYDPAPVAQLDPDRTADLVRVNVLGTLDVARLCPPLLRDGGQLVLFGSVAGYLGLPNGQAYSMTKAAVNNLAETLRVELAPRVDVRLVCPGFVATRMTARNDFPMPGIITPEKAAQLTLRGLQSKAFEIHFPKHITFALKALAMMPYFIAFAVTRRMKL
ncbi:SDR family NAD(P)-dependent oxidoreductase [Ketogulonicigenium vulgare]|uniref:Short-chain dehydrogenase/reductase SDR n=1 Tax=Ketogulonicigenium vulgare (strain WSH-001) TaxID=759362 RepID=F9Y6H3_KETVW|nr:SDR family NAD(P)-dependent oxidoreductase [Ketogulonicigenium vulgare]ADO42729.1 short-chain dehydrogenase/reductase SDR [Ketogulonicigenium vulgare Y25]AEM40919.1 Short-chain dehydrogenase/reductase SDR [Ketogulonicigenium vulgare WSH-001]ALJ81073.1 short-chain dehydrogenase [Ketogulonicigenium vulgare]ANW33828.1 short-chain dehydrogenase [Ketogulonicigenium vulgare]AOZ54641.1 short-chain dehydrogenase/reductase SDR [Ketogulonicigenium vulgare]